MPDDPGTGGPLRSRKAPRDLLLWLIAAVLLLALIGWRALLLTMPVPPLAEPGHPGSGGTRGPTVPVGVRYRCLPAVDDERR